MKKLFNREKKNNKGFTLVELVVVVAILAILVGLLAPQYTKYVEKSRQSADATNVDNIVRTVQIAATEPESAFVTGNDGTIITFSGKNAVAVAGDNKAAIENALTEALGAEWENVKIKSTRWKETGITVKVMVAGSTKDDKNPGAVTVTYEPDDFAEFVKKTATTPDSSTGV